MQQVAHQLGFRNCPVQPLFRVINTGYLCSEEYGQVKVDLVTRRNVQVDRPSIDKRLAIFEYLKSLRLMISLLKHNNALSSMGLHFRGSFRSALALQASLTSA